MGMLGQVKQFHRDQKRFLSSQITASVFNNIISGVFMTGLLLYIGVAPSRTGIFLSIPLLANIFQVLLGRMWSRFRDYKSAMNRLILISRYGILSVAIIPLVMRGMPIWIRVCAAGIILTVSYTLAASAGIHLNFWMVSTVDTGMQGTFFSFRDRIVVAATLVISLTAAWMLDRLETCGMEYAGFALAFFFAAILAVADYQIIRRIEYAGTEHNAGRDRIIPVRHILEENRRFVKFLIYILCLNMALNMANPYYNSYMLDSLKLKYIQVTCMTALQVVVQIAVSAVWEKIGNRIRWSRILNTTVMILGMQFFVWAFVTEKTIFLLPIIFVTSGMISTGLVTGQFMIPYEFIDRNRAMACLSISTGVAAAGGFAGSIAGSMLISSLKECTIFVGSISIGSMQINMMVSGAALLLTVLYAEYIFAGESDKHTF